MAIQVRLCEPAHVPLVLHALLGWHGSDAAGALPGARALLALTRMPERGSLWLVERRGVPVGYAVVEPLSPCGFLWQEARLAALFIAPEARHLGIARAVRHVLQELLLGSGCALLVQTTPADRHWAPLLAPADEWSPAGAAA
jgi:GNAT superfamily N-acetyltransferase